MLLNRVTHSETAAIQTGFSKRLWFLLTEGEMTEVYAEPIPIEVTEVRQVS